MKIDLSTVDPEQRRQFLSEFNQTELGQLLSAYTEAVGNAWTSENLEHMTDEQIKQMCEDRKTIHLKLVSHLLTMQNQITDHGWETEYRRNMNI